MKILHVSTADVGGGAEKIAWNLFETQRTLGHTSWLAVGEKRSSHPAVLTVPNDASRSAWTRSLRAVSDSLEQRHGGSRIAAIGASVAVRAAEPMRVLRRFYGIEDFAYPGTWRLLDLCPLRPDVVHLHNLHGSYFDLRALPWLSRRVPIVLTLHDAWTLSGHCAQSYDCRRWMTGCGNCPDLKTYPRIARDATAHNWRRKAGIYRRSRLHVATPSRWLMDRVDRSMLTGGIVGRRVVHNGIDAAVFRPGNREESRAVLGLPADAGVLFCAANRIRENDSKDFPLMRAAVAGLSRASGPIVFVAMGEQAATERIGRAEIRFLPFQADPSVVAQYYRAADVYVHGARAESWGLAVTEALATGTPVVATAVGGIPEQVKSLVSCHTDDQVRTPAHGLEQATGILVPPRDVGALTRAIEALLTDESLRAQLGRNAAADASSRFDMQGQVHAYLRWYEALIDRPAAGAGTAIDTRHAN